MVVAAGACALVLTVVRQSPEGVAADRPRYARCTCRPRRAAQRAPRPVGARRSSTRRCSKVKERYVDPSRDRPEEDAVRRARQRAVQHPRGARRARHRQEHGRRRGQRQARGVRRPTTSTRRGAWSASCAHLPLHRDQHERRRRPREGRVRGRQRHALDARSALDPDRSRAGARHGRVDERQVRRPRHRHPHDRPQAHRREADEGHAGVAEGHQGRRSHRQDQQRAHREHDAQRGRRPHARRPEAPASRCGSSARATTNLLRVRPRPRRHPRLAGRATSCSTRASATSSVKQFSKGIATRCRRRDEAR